VIAVPKTIKIAIADDNVNFKNILVEYLSTVDGFAVVGTAENGIDAIELIKDTRPDIILLDIIMPRLGGFGVLEEINRLHISKTSQVIVISAFGQEKIMQIALDLGAEFFMLKPFDMNELVTSIKQIYDLRLFKEIKDIDLRDANHTDTATKVQIVNLLCEIGVPSHLKGYDYIEYAAEILLKDLTAINSITKQIYSRISAVYNTTPQRVERVIRNAIEVTWARGNINVLYNMFDTCLSEDRAKPSNSDFLIILVNELLIRRKKSLRPQEIS
jgi:two-component system, response regulator, stage 0 sporulation protein A